MYITDYFRQIDDAISNCHSVICKEVLFEQRTKYIGLIKGTLTFGDGSELFFKEFIDTEIRITKYKYGYHYQKDNKQNQSDNFYPESEYDEDLYLIKWLKQFEVALGDSTLIDTYQRRRDSK